MTFGAFLSGETPHRSCRSFAVAHLGEVKREYVAIRCCVASILFVAWEKSQSECFIKPQTRLNWHGIALHGWNVYFIHWLFPLLHRTLEIWQESGEEGSGHDPDRNRTQIPNSHVSQLQHDWNFPDILLQLHDSQTSNGKGRRLWFF